MFCTPRAGMIRHGVCLSLLAAVLAFGLLGCNNRPPEPVRTTELPPHRIPKKPG